MIKKSLLAGVLIAFAAIFCNLSGGGIIGALLFSIGIISVILLKANLYTGKIGYVSSGKDVIQAISIFTINIIAAGILGFIYKFIINSVDISNRLDLSWYEYLFRSIICGVCIYLSVECNKKSGNLITAILPIMAFILAGGQHSVANAFYFCAGAYESIAEIGKAILYLFIAAIGNAIGSLLTRVLQTEPAQPEVITIDVK